jgi:cullin 1
MQTKNDLVEGWNFIVVNGLNRLEEWLESDTNTTSKLFKDNAEYVAVYTRIYDMCIQNSIELNYAEEIYKRHGRAVSSYFADKVLPELQTKRKESLIREFVKRMENNDLMIKWHTKFFMYVEKFYINGHGGAPNTNARRIPSLETAILLICKAVMFDDIKINLTEAILDFINDERQGILIDRDLIRRCIKYLEKLGVTKLEVYRQDFETHLLASTRGFYKSVSEMWLREESTSSYISKVSSTLRFVVLIVLIEKSFPYFLLCPV